MNQTHDIICTVSPSMFGGETKNQDRAIFDFQTNTAGLCDGTTSSPNSGKAAEFVTQNASIIADDPKKNLNVVSEMLYSYRHLAIKRGVKIHSSIPDSMKEIVQDAAKQALKNSFQTTMVTAGFIPEESSVHVKCVTCGDSGFFAFSPSGQLLFSNLVEIEEHLGQCQQKGMIHFVPGSELLIRPMGNLSIYPDIAKNSHIKSPCNWLLCRAICLCNNSESSECNSEIYLQPNELLLVPKYLVSTPKDPNHREFGRLLYSQFIRQLSCPQTNSPDIHFDGQGNTTAVLPDHYGTGRWETYEDRFPSDTSFLLCSDGFYRAFLNPLEIWDWLKANEHNLYKQSKRDHLLTELHKKTHRTCGDDDISLIWISPKSEKEKS